MPPFRPDRRSVASLSGLALLSAALGGCGVFEDKRKATARTGSARKTADTIGRGSVKVALILPLSGAGAAGAAATALRNAAELAMGEFQAPNLKILVKDDRGTPEGAGQAAAAALAGGAELILGPLFAPAVTAVRDVAGPAGVPAIAFSTDAAVARRGVYLLSFMPQSEVERLLDHAAESGQRSLAALVPATPYGQVVEWQFGEAARRHGIKVAAVERYEPGRPDAAVGRLAPLFTGARPAIDGLLIPEGGDGMAALGEALEAAGFDPRRVRPLGTGMWNDPRVLRVAAVAGGWFAAPDAAGFNAFAERYRARFGAAPARIATLSYDAVSLAAALARNPPRERFTTATLESPAGFAGADGVFRFRADGVNERALAVLEVRSGGTSVASPAPKALGGSGA